MVAVGFDVDKQVHRILGAIVLSLCLHLLVLTYLGLGFSTDKAAGRNVLVAKLLTSKGESVNTFAADIPVVAEEIKKQQLLAEERSLAKKNVDSKPQKSQAVVEIKPDQKSVDTIKHSGNELVQPIQEHYQSPGIQSLGRGGAYQEVELDVEIISGVDRQLVKRAKHRYSSDREQNYGVTIEPVLGENESSEAQSWRFGISGSITMQGLSPSMFEVTGAEGAVFIGIGDSSSAPKIGAGSTKKGRIRDGILDRQSLLYQFMLRPPQPNGGNLMLSDGKRNIHFKYHLQGFDSFFVNPLGMIQASKIVFSSSESKEEIVVWLIPELNYLPVKMLHVGENGATHEVIVHALRYQ